MKCCIEQTKSKHERPSEPSKWIYAHLGCARCGTNWMGVFLPDVRISREREGCPNCGSRVGAYPKKDQSEVMAGR